MPMLQAVGSRRSEQTQTAHPSLIPPNHLTWYRTHLNDIGSIQTIDAIHPKDTFLFGHQIVVRDPQISTRDVKFFGVEPTGHLRLPLERPFLLCDKLTDVLIPRTNVSA